MPSPDRCSWQRARRRSTLSTLPRIARTPAARPPTASPRTGVDHPAGHVGQQGCVQHVVDRRDDRDVDLTRCAAARDRCRAHSKPVNPLPTITTDVLAGERSSAEVGSSRERSSAEVGSSRERSSAEVGSSRERSSAEVGSSRERSSAVIALSRERSSADVGLPSTGDRLRAIGGQPSELRRQPWLAATGAQLTADDGRPLRDAAVTEEQERDRVRGDPAVGLLARRGSYCAGPVVDRHPVAGPAAHLQLEADAHARGATRPQVLRQDGQHFRDDRSGRRLRRSSTGTGPRPSRCRGRGSAARPVAGHAIVDGPITNPLGVASRGAGAGGCRGVQISRRRRPRACRQGDAGSAPAPHRGVGR